MTKKQKNKTIEDKDETIIEMAPIIKEKYTKLFLIISLTLSSLSIVLMIFFSYGFHLMILKKFTRNYQKF